MRLPRTPTTSHAQSRLAKDSVEAGRADEVSFEIWRGNRSLVVILKEVVDEVLELRSIGIPAGFRIPAVLTGIDPFVGVTEVGILPSFLQSGIVRSFLFLCKSQSGGNKNESGNGPCHRAFKQSEGGGFVEEGEGKSGGYEWNSSIY